MLKAGSSIAVIRIVKRRVNLGEPMAIRNSVPVKGQKTPVGADNQQVRMMYKKSPESTRDDAMSQSLVDVQIAAKRWAANSADGALVWIIANEFHELWHEWGLALTQPAWTVPETVLRTLENIARHTSDESVTVRTNFARTALSSYSEPASAGLIIG